MPYEDAASPAERYAQARERTVHPRLTAFEAELRFALDRFQRDACAALDDGQSVLVAAPTGAGKTVVAEFAVFLAMSNPATKLFYTAPIKALSNQKYQELCAAWGPEDVGLLTGDAYVNATARIVVMTTEVLRNMLYAESPLLENLGFVVMDEVHYLADRTRGAVWEEVIIHLPTQVRLVSLSATVSNAEELGAWLHTVRGDTAVILSEDRPVPLHQHVLIRDRVVDLFGSTPGRVNPELRQLTRAFGERPAPGAVGDHRHAPSAPIPRTSCASWPATGSSRPSCSSLAGQGATARSARSFGQDCTSPKTTSGQPSNR